MPSLSTLIIGASENPERYAYKAIQLLVENGHQVQALAPKMGFAHGVHFKTDIEQIEKPVHTVSLYINPNIQVSFIPFLISLKPNRVIFNPGTESKETQVALEKADIAFEEACTLVLLRSGQF